MAVFVFCFERNEETNTESFCDGSKREVGRVHLGSFSFFHYRRKNPPILSNGDWVMRPGARAEWDVWNKSEIKEEKTRNINILESHWGPTTSFRRETD